VRLHRVMCAPWAWCRYGDHALRIRVSGFRRLPQLRSARRAPASSVCKRRSFPWRRTLRVARARTTPSTRDAASSACSSCSATTSAMGWPL
jgi:hypothetical protein